MGVRLVVRSRGGEKVPGEPEFPFEQDRIVIGRGGASDVRIPDRSVSEHHATVQLRNDHYVITDLGSTNGTRVEGQRLQREVPKKLRDADRITLGHYELTFHMGVLVTEAVSAERTAELARRLLRDAEGAKGKRLPAPRLCVLSGPRTGQTLDLPAHDARLVIGSGETSQLVLPDAGLASEHCELICDSEGALCRGIGGRTFGIAGNVVQSRRLRDGDELLFGGTRVLFEEPAQALLDALRADADEVVVTPPPPAPAPPEKTETLATKNGLPPSAAVKAAQEKPVRSEADLLIYVLAGVVLVASALGLLFLLHAR